MTINSTAIKEMILEDGIDLVESGQTYIADVDNCIECMRACPAGEAWKKNTPERATTAEIRRYNPIVN